MATERDLVSMLRRHDERLAATPTRFALDLRVQRALRQARKGKRTALRYASLGGALLAAIAVLLFSRTPPVSTVDGDAVHGQLPIAPCSIQSNGLGARYTGRCQVDNPAVSIQTQDGAELTRDGALWSVERGRCRFVVTPRTEQQPPLRVQVSGGVIEVTGTEFLIEQSEAGGKVDLFEGTIRFLAPGRAPIEMHPGESFAWSSPVVPEASSSSEDDVPGRHDAPPSTASSAGENSGVARSGVASTSETTASSAQRDREDAAMVGDTGTQDTGTQDTGTQDTGAQRDVLDRVHRLRSSGRYDEALRALPEMNSDALDDEDREVLSYERGTLLERSGQIDAACEHWAAHARKYPKGSYRSLVATRLSRCAKPLGSAPPSPSR